MLTTRTDPKWPCDACKHSNVDLDKEPCLSCHYQSAPALPTNFEPGINQDSVVVPLHEDRPNASGINAPDPAIIEQLETLLAQAKSGEVRAIVVGARLPVGNFRVYWQSASEVTYSDLIALSARLAHEILADDLNNRNSE